MRVEFFQCRRKFQTFEKNEMKCKKIIKKCEKLKEKRLFIYFKNVEN